MWWQCNYFKLNGSDCNRDRSSKSNLNTPKQVEVPVTSEESSSSSSDESIKKPFNDSTDEQDVCPPPYSTCVTPDCSLNLSLLQPVELMTITVNINGQQVSALLDSGVVVQTRYYCYCTIRAIC